jgi:chromate transporter
MMLEVLLEFLRFGVLSIGGGFALIAEMKRVLVVERAWLSAQVFVDGWSLGQFVPGPNMLAMAFYGFRVEGLLGALLAWLGMFTPGIVLSIVAARVWQKIRHSRTAQVFRNAILPIGFGFGAGGVYTLARVSIGDLAAFGLLAVLGGLLFYKRLDPIGAVFVGGLIGIGLRLLQN